MTAPLPPCVDCERPLRRRSEPAVPGSVVHQGHGRCGGCFTRARREAGYERPNQPRRRGPRPEFPPELLTPQPINPTWRDQAACRDVSYAEAWFPPSGAPTDAVLATCNSCPVARDCLETALHLEEGTGHSSRAGIWGGLGAGARARLARARSRKRRNRQENAA